MSQEYIISDIVDREMVVRDRNMVPLMFQRWFLYLQGLLVVAPQGGHYSATFIICKNVELSSRPYSYLSYPRPFQLKANGSRIWQLKKKEFIVLQIKMIYLVTREINYISPLSYTHMKQKISNQVLYFNFNGHQH